MARGPTRGPSTRPAWTRLGILGGTLVVLYGSMALTGTLTPKLGLDLRGGTSVILTPRSAVAGGKVDSGAVDKAVDVIRQRVNGLGVAEAEVKRAGNRIEISVPGRGRSDVVDLVGQTAELRFREVVESARATPAPPSPSPSPSPRPSATPSPGRSPAVAPSPTGTARPRAEGRVPLAGPDVAVPAAQRTPGPGPTSAPRQTPAPSAAGDASTPPPAVVAAYQGLTCSKTDIRRGRVGNEGPQDWLAACDRDGQAKYLLKPAQVVGTDVKGATATVDSSRTSTGQWEVIVSFTSGGQGKFTRLTEQTVGKQVAIVLDGVVQSAPTIEVRIAGDAQITGSFSQSEAEDLANILRYGALPLAFEKSQAESISPTLGRDSLNAGLLAGALGLFLVVVYSFIYYRVLGIVTIASLLVSGALVYASVVLLGEGIDFTLTLAGVAGLIVSVGVTADSFIVFYERLKDEAREGRSVRTSVERGWVRARRTILSADTVSFLGAAALYLLSIGSVRGFAFALGLSTVIDVFVVFVFTKPVVTLLVRKRFFAESRWSGLSVKALSRPPEQAGPKRPTLTKRAPAGTTAGAGREA